MPHDLAAILTRKIEQIFSDVRDPAARRQHVEELLRDEIAAVQMETIGKDITLDG